MHGVAVLHYRSPSFSLSRHTGEKHRCSTFPARIAKSCCRFEEKALVGKFSRTEGELLANDIVAEQSKRLPLPWRGSSPNEMGMAQEYLVSGTVDSDLSRSEVARNQSASRRAMWKQRTTSTGEKCCVAFILVCRKGRRAGGDTEAKKLLD